MTKMKKKIKHPDVLVYPERPSADAGEGVNKDFDWYRERFFKVKKFPDAMFVYLNPEHWLWEYRFGLLKFICDDLNVDFFDFVFYLKRSIDTNTDSIKPSDFTKVLSICDDNFLNLIINE